MILPNYPSKFFQTRAIHTHIIVSSSRPSSLQVTGSFLSSPSSSQKVSPLMVKPTFRRYLLHPLPPAGPGGSPSTISPMSNRRRILASCVGAWDFWIWRSICPSSSTTWQQMVGSESVSVKGKSVMMAFCGISTG